MIQSLQCGLWGMKTLRLWLDDYYKEEKKTLREKTVQQRSEKILVRLCNVIKSGKKSSKSFNSIHLMFLIDQAVRDKLSIKRPMNGYTRLIPEILEAVSEKKEEATFNELNDFVLFLCTLNITEFDDLVAETVPLYVKQRNVFKTSYGKPPFLVVNALARALSGNMSEIDSIRKEFLSLNPEHKCSASDNMAYNLWNIIQSSEIQVYLEKSKYDGAHLIEPVTGLYDKHSIAVQDMSGFYPGCMIETSTGVSTEISFDKVQALLESGTIIEGRDFVCVNVHRIDDGIDWKRYANDYPEYVKHNFVFLLSKEMCESVYASQLKRGIKRRNIHKYKAQDASLSKRERLEHLNKSNTLKVNNNAKYGLFKIHTPTIRLSAVVTSRARTFLKNTITWLSENFDIEEIYGDTDSIMDRCRLSDVELLNFVYNGTRDAVESYFRTDILGLTQCQLREECDALFTAGKSVRYVGANLVATLSKSIQNVQ